MPICAQRKDRPVHLLKAAMVALCVLPLTACEGDETEPPVTGLVLDYADAPAFLHHVFFPVGGVQPLQDEGTAPVDLTLAVYCDGGTGQMQGTQTRTADALEIDVRLAFADCDTGETLGRGYQMRMTSDPHVDILATVSAEGWAFDIDGTIEALWEGTEGVCELDVVAVLLSSGLYRLTGEVCGHTYAGVDLEDRMN